MNPIQLIHPVHPFPARMATEIALEEMKDCKHTITVLDPMNGSGTTSALAVRTGHRAVGFDTDPLAVLIAKVWCSRSSRYCLKELGHEVLMKAKEIRRKTTLERAYPSTCMDEETKRYIKYWYDPRNHRQLFSLSEAIRSVGDETSRNMLWCAFSRMIIKKYGGVSLAVDVAHSRPHKVLHLAETEAFDVFEKEVDKVLLALKRSSDIRHDARISIADARDLPLANKSVDLVITSPPYLNAIDYLRGHRMSLVWMGFPLHYLRFIRANNIGSEVGGLSSELIGKYGNILSEMCNKRRLPRRLTSMLYRYLNDLDKVLHEVSRVLYSRGKAIFVVGDSISQGFFIKNTTAIAELGRENGLELVSAKKRLLPEDRRYLPPPSRSEGTISRRMRTETVLSFRRT